MLESRANLSVSIWLTGAVKDIDVTGYSGGSILVDSGKLWFNDSAKYMHKLPEWGTITYKTKHANGLMKDDSLCFKTMKKNS